MPLPLQASEQVVLVLLLKILGTCVAKMPRTESNFALDLEKKVVPIINRALGGNAVGPLALTRPPLLALF